MRYLAVVLVTVAAIAATDAPAEEDTSGFAFFENCKLAVNLSAGKAEQTTDNIRRGSWCVLYLQVYFEGIFAATMNRAFLDAASPEEAGKKLSSRNYWGRYCFASLDARSEDIQRDRPKALVPYLMRNPAVLSKPRLELLEEAFSKIAECPTEGYLAKPW